MHMHWHWYNQLGEVERATESSRGFVFYGWGGTVLVVTKWSFVVDGWAWSAVRKIE
jgi:hypothetical protein